MKEVIVILFIAIGLFSAVMIPYIRKREDIEQFKYRFAILAGILFVISLGFAKQLSEAFISSAGDNVILLAIGAFMYGWGSQSMIIELGKILKKIAEYIGYPIK